MLPERKIYYFLYNQISASLHFLFIEFLFKNYKNRVFDDIDENRLIKTPKVVFLNFTQDKGANHPSPVR
ncbi:hypothetical protein [Azospirillum argentinense]